MSNNVLILPLLIPLVTGIIMGIARNRIGFQRLLGLFSLGLTFAVSLYLVRLVSKQGVQILELGGWQAPFGIVLVLDMLPALLLATASLVGFACLLYAVHSIGEDKERHYFYPLFNFLLVGVNGSFLTGDMFNLFVFFEVMLFASYVLLVLGGTKIQLRETIKYAFINTLSSTLFLVGIAYLYAVAGTLNMAHLSLRIAEAGQTGILTGVAVVFLIVFSVKAGLLLYFWLPGSYMAPPGAVGAIFAALLTKVGIYVILRVYTLIFYHQPEVTHGLMAVMAGLTMLLGGFGAIAQWDIRGILVYNVIISVGFIISGLVYGTAGALTGAVYYTIHDMVMKALLFLLGGTVIAITGTSKLKAMSGLIRNHTLLGWLFFVTTLALAGIPPLSGFVGKVLIIKEGLALGTGYGGLYVLAGIGLLSSMLVLYSLLKIFINGFWGETVLSEEMEKGTDRGLLLPCVLLTAVSLFIGLGAEFLYPYVDQAVTSLLHPGIYIEAVLGEVF
ncbi:MAG TPA: Na+/H+ antiporter subunit D [Clostridia bacterium]|nr:Na+/H+ antiporter subunit D [Clostridia bacterium]